MGVGPDLIGGLPECSLEYPYELDFGISCSYKTSQAGEWITSWVAFAMLEDHNILRIYIYIYIHIGYIGI